MSDIVEELYEEEHPYITVLKRVMIGGIAIFLVILMLTYLVPTDIVAGLVASDTLKQDYSVSLKNGGEVRFTQETYLTLQKIYFDNPETEFKVCLGGEHEGKDYFIDSLYIPKTHLKTFASVHSEQCNSETLIPLHKHPYRSCIFSEQDHRSHEAFKKIQPHALMGLMCESGRFTFYGAKSTEC